MSTLETFAGDRWIENLFPTDLGQARRSLPADPLVPRRDARPGAWLEQKVTVEGLEDTRVPAAAEPARIDGPELWKRLVSERRRDRGAPAAPPKDPVHGLELRPAPDAACARRFAAALSGLGRPLPRGGEGSIPRVRRVWPREARRSCLPGRAVPAALGLPASVAGGAQADCKGPLAVRGDARSGALVPQPRRLPLRGAPAGEHDQPAARRFRRGDPRRLLPALRGRDGGDAAHARDPVPCRSRLHRRDVEGRRLDGDRPSGARLGRGLVRGVRLARVRPDAGPWDALSRLHARVGLRRRGPRARDRALPRLRRGAVRGIGASDARGSSGRSQGLPVVDRSRRRHPPGGRGGRGRGEAGTAHDATPARRSAAACGGRARRQLVSALVDRGAALRRDATPRELRHAAERVLATPTGALTDALAEARYGPPSRARAAAARARSELVRVLAAASERETPGDRLRATFSLRSLRPGPTPSAR